MIASSSGRWVSCDNTESGFAALRKPDQDKAGYYEAHDKGWDAHLASLENYVAGQS